MGLEENAVYIFKIHHSFPRSHSLQQGGEGHISGSAKDAIGCPNIQPHTKVPLKSE
jgi:hypothetical protein